MKGPSDPLINGVWFTDGISFWGETGQGFNKRGHFLGKFAMEDEETAAQGVYLDLIKSG